MSDDDADPIARPRPAPEPTPSTWNNPLYPPGRDAFQRMVERRIAEKRLAAKRAKLRQRQRPPLESL